jgi:hypothetical protein
MLAWLGPKHVVQLTNKEIANCERWFYYQYSSWQLQNLCRWNTPLESVSSKRTLNLNASQRFRSCCELTATVVRTTWYIYPLCNALPFHKCHLHSRKKRQLYENNHWERWSRACFCFSRREVRKPTTENSKYRIRPQISRKQPFNLFMLSSSLSTPIINILSRSNGASNSLTKHIKNSC